LQNVTTQNTDLEFRNVIQSVFHRYIILYTVIGTFIQNYVSVEYTLYHVAEFEVCILSCYILQFLFLTLRHLEEGFSARLG